MDGAQDSIEELAAKVDLLKREVDALQIANMANKRPWYKDIPTIIASLALMFSFGTTYVSYTRTQAQDIQNSRAELRSLLQRLAALPKENLELTNKYAQDANNSGYLSSLILQEGTLLAQQAAEIIDRLPPDQVTAIEYYAVGDGLRNSGDNTQAIDMFLKAIDAATEMNTEVSAWREYAALLFETGQPDAGRDAFSKALTIFSKYPGYSEYVQKSTHILTEMGWAQNETTIGSLDLAMEHLVNADALAYWLDPGPYTDRLKQQIEQTKRTVMSSDDWYQ